MSRRFELELPQTLTDDDAKLVIQILEALIDLLARQVQHLDRQVRPPDEHWTVPEWMQTSTETQ